MKKGLSVLLIAAALFGFYGGATSLTDILASKDYWEEQGEKSTADMNKLEDGLNQLKDNEKAYLDGQKQLADGEKQLADAEKQLADGEAKLADGKAELAKGYADYAAAPAKLRAGEAALAKGQKEYAAGMSTYNSSKAKLDTLEANLKKLNEAYSGWEEGYISAMTPNPDLGNVSPVEAFGLKDELGRIRSANITEEDQMLIKGAAAKKLDDTLKSKLPPEVYGAIVGVVLKHTPSATTIEEDFETLISFLSQETLPLGPGGTPVPNQYKGYVPVLQKGQKDLSNSLASLEELKKLEPGRDTLSGLFNQLLDEVAKDPANVEKLGGQAALKLVRDGLSKNASDDMFAGTVNTLFKKAGELIKYGRSQLAIGKKQLETGAATIAAGKAELAQGYADYAAAPGKLADGEKQVADGEKQLADGYKQYEDGKKALADGKKKLAEYEDGEQQVRDGLATLMATEADPGLESILDRRNGDDKFDDANGHLQLDEGLAAVDTGRGYQADSGELITKEITNRAVGTAAGLGAAALAVLAAILSFLKKSKGAAVSAVLAAVAGGIGAGVGLSAGEYYSDIAGSTIGNTPFIAAAVLAAVAAVFAIVHFTAKPEAK